VVSFQQRFRSLAATASSTIARVAGCEAITTTAVIAAIAKSSKKPRRSECRIMTGFLTDSMRHFAIVKRSASFIFGTFVSSVREGGLECLACTIATSVEGLTCRIFAS